MSKFYKHLSYLFIAFVASFLLFVNNINAQQTYLPGIIYVKFEESASSTQKLTFQDKVASNILSFLQQYGGGNIQPFWTPGMEQSYQQLKRKNKRTFVASTNPFDNLKRIKKITIDTGYDTRLLATKIASLPGVEFAEPHYVRELHLEPNDPSIQDNMEFMNFFSAWDINSGSEDVVIGIIDSGVDYSNDDLDDNLWVNQDEIPSSIKSTVDGNDDGTVTSTEIKDWLISNNNDFDGSETVDLRDALHSSSPLTDGTDTDGNDFADDIFGWDFWASGTTNNTIEQDNDPVGDGSNHGTHVAGIAAAESDNGFGIAGTSFNARYMPVKAGGIPDDPGTPADESAQIGFGFNGILYAALNGADIINNSWGGPGSSQLQQEIVNSITDLGVVIVASAGNANSEGAIFPAGYENVLSVGSVDFREGQKRTKSSFSNFGFDVDVFATGNLITSTVFNNGVGVLSGTSMSSPAVAGLAALVKSEFPDWSAPQILMQIRNTSTFLDGFNPELRNKMGHGVINARFALENPMPGIRVDSTAFVNSEGNKLGLSEPGKIIMKLENVGISTSNLTLTAQPIVDNLSPSSQEITIGSVSQNETITAEIDFEIGSDFEINGPIPAVRLTFEDAENNYQDRVVIQYEELLFDTIDNNAALMSAGSEGTLGFTDPFQQTGGVGFVPRVMENGEFVNTRNQLFEGGLMIEANGSVVSAVRGTADTPDRDFAPEEIMRLQKPGTTSDLDGRAVFTTDEGPPMRITQHTFSFTDQDLANSVFVRYDVENLDSAPLEDVRIGIFNDWDVGDFSSNIVDFSSPDSLLFVQDDSDNSQPYVGVAHMGEIASAFAIENGFEGAEDSLNFNIFNSGDLPGYADQEKSYSLRADTFKTTAGPTDVSTVVASGPYDIATQTTLTTGFIYSWGNTLDELRQQVASARELNLFDVGESSTFTDVEDEFIDTPGQTKLHNNFPNPFNPATQIQFDLAQASEVELSIYNILGKKVATLVNGRRTAGTHQIRFDASGLSSGIYLGVLETPNARQTIKLSLVK